MCWSVCNTSLTRCICLLEGFIETISLIVRVQLGTHVKIPQVTGLACGKHDRGTQKGAFGKVDGAWGTLCKKAGTGEGGGGRQANLPTCQHMEAACASQQGAKSHLVVEVVKQPKHAMFVIRVSLIDVFQQLDLVQALVKIVLVVLHAYHSLSSMPNKCLNAV